MCRGTIIVPVCAKTAQLLLLCYYAAKEILVVDNTWTGAANSVELCIHFATVQHFLRGALLKLEKYSLIPP
jgi:hypothetical protein